MSVTQIVMNCSRVGTESTARDTTGSPDASAGTRSFTSHRPEMAFGNAVAETGSTTGPKGTNPGGNVTDKLRGAAVVTMAPVVCAGSVRPTPFKIIVTKEPG